MVSSVRQGRAPSGCLADTEPALRLPSTEGSSLADVSGSETCGPLEDSSDALLAKLAGATVDEILLFLREYLAMPVAFVGEFTRGRRIVRFVNGTEQGSALLHRRSDVMSKTYCRMIVDHAIPAAIPRIDEIPELSELEVTAELNIAAYLGVPIHLSSGDLYGTLCCFAHEPADDLPADVVRIMAVAASFVARRLESPDHGFVDVLQIHERIAAILAHPEGLRIVYQPIVELATGRHVGYEALSRFPGFDSEGPEVLFADAYYAGLGTAFELLAVRRALELLPRLSDGQFLSVNLSSAVLRESATRELLRSARTGQIVIELTEQQPPQDRELLDVIAELRDDGARLAVDDLGSGFAGLSRLVALRPDIVKFDRFLSLDVAEDPVRKALLVAALSFCEATSTALIVEGVETPADCEALKHAGVKLAQGFLLGRPGPALAGAMSV
jgi:EAL domain-containing protein (putative c-di-GMP-specific phosphodiesterase class I)